MDVSLSHDIQKKSDELIKVVSPISVEERRRKVIQGTGGRVSVSDLIAYQIGWGKNLIRWYEVGSKGGLPQMPGEGFLKWDYRAIAKHFYQNYAYDGSIQQLKVFQEAVSLIVEITEKEGKAGNLDQEGRWSWCTLASGKKWPLCKWIKVNTVSPYKRAIQLIKKANFSVN